MVSQHPGAGGAPRLLAEQLLGIARLAVIVLDDQGRVSHWNRVADELFGVPPETAIGRQLRALLRLPQEHREAFAPGGPRIRHVWTGVCLVPRVDDGVLHEIAWWVYPLVGPGSARVLAVAADAQRLRDEGPGLALGDVVLVPPPRTPLTGEGGVRVLRVEPTLYQVTADGDALLSRRLGELLPLMGPDGSDSIVRQVLGRGYPAVNVSVTLRLPFASYWGSAPRVKRVRTVDVEPGTLAGGAHDRLDLLNDAGARIVETLDPSQTAKALCDALVPRFADFAGVHLIERVVSEQEFPGASPDESTKTARVAVTHNDEPGRWDDVVPVGEVFRLPPGTPFLKCMTTGRSVNVPRVSGTAARQISAQFGDRNLRPLIEGRALMIAPLIARGTVFGNVLVMRRPGRPPFDEPDVATAEELARRAAVCIDNGRLYRREARAAAELQRSMLPAAPPIVPGAQICYRYVPAGEAVRVGGDWFDAIPLPGGRLALVVGDVMGHGLTSAAIMGQLRTAVRTLAAQDLPPGLLLRQLDDLARRLGDDYIATCVYAVYDPVARRCEVAAAGHLPPVVVSPYGAPTLIRVPAGAPIGVGGVAFETVEFDLEDDSLLVMYTDGLVERRGQSLDAGLTALCDHLAGPAKPLESVCDAVLDGLDYVDRRDDDIALLAVRCEGIPDEDVKSWTFDADPANVQDTRRSTRETLAEWGMADLVDQVELMVSELVTNAVLHGAGDIGLRLIRAGALLCEVRDDGNDLPYLCHADTTDEHGRGLQLVTALADRWGTNRTPTGKVVWFECALP